MNPLGVDFITLLGHSPIELIRAADDAGCQSVGLILEQSPINPEGHPHFSLIEDDRLRREVKAILRDTGISVELVDGFAVAPDCSVERHRASLDVVAELGCNRINTISFDPDMARTLAETNQLVTIAGQYGMTITLEACPMLTVKTLAAAMDMLQQINQPHFKLLIDTLHLCRSGEGPGALSAINPSLIDYVQISDGPQLVPNASDYMAEAMFDRQIPGQGELPLVDILGYIHDGTVVSLETPLTALAASGTAPTERVRLAAMGARQVMTMANMTLWETRV